MAGSTSKAQYAGQIGHQYFLYANTMVAEGNNLVLLLDTISTSISKLVLAYISNTT